MSYQTLCKLITMYNVASCTSYPQYNLIILFNLVFCKRCPQYSINTLHNLITLYN